MKLTPQGLALIKASEGFRGLAYRDAVGIWTVGFGHTSMAGPPHVAAGLRLTEAQASELLARDVDKFALQMAPLITRPLNASQFSALVSFAYNVGVGAFAHSGVLAAVNAGDFAAVPRRLMAWNKAGGRVLPGLVKRRAAEGALFATDPQIQNFSGFLDLSYPETELQEMQHLRGQIDTPFGKGMLESTTNRAAMGQWLAGLGGILSGGYEAARRAMSQYSDLAWYLPGEWTFKIIIGIGLTAGLIWIVNERRSKSRDEGI